MISWKTTLFGLISALLSAISSGAVPTTPEIQKAAGVIAGISVGALGLSAKDNNVTGGTKVQ